MKLSEVKIKVQIENATLKQRFGLWIVNKQIRLIQWLFADEPEKLETHLKDILKPLIRSANSNIKKGGQ